MTLDNKGLGKEEWIGVMNVVGFIDVVLFNLFWFSSQRTFVTRYVSAVKEDTVSWNAHTSFNLNDVTNN